MLLNMTRGTNDNDTWQTLSAATDRALQSLDMGKLSVKTVKRGLVSRASLFNGIEAPEMDALVLKTNARNPRSTVTAAENTTGAGAGFVGKNAVGDILRAGSLSQVSNPIVRRISVDVVDLISWPASMDVKPNQAVNEIGTMVNDNHAPAAAALVDRACNGPDQALPIPSRLHPDKIPSERVISENPADLFGGYHDQASVKLTEEKHERSDEERSRRNDDKSKSTDEARYIEQRMRDIERFEAMVRGYYRPRRKRI